MWKGGKGKGKPIQYNEISTSLSPAALATSTFFMLEHDIGTKAVVDTGASENADAAGSLARTVERRETPYCLRSLAVMFLSMSLTSSF